MSSVRRTRIWPALAIAALVLLLAAPIAAGFYARETVNDSAVPVVRDLWVEGAPRVALAIWAHPDDEITSAGTLARMGHDPDAQLVLVYLTRGEAYDGTDLAPEALARVRTREAQEAGRILGAEETI
ncbi:MAG: PIG-L family deacetylase, partial [Hyphomonadaceae bacterium]